jgi:low temperature requirement protein LtrA
MAGPAVAAALRITDALIEPFGLLIIVVLGEILTGVVAGLASQPISGLTLSVGHIAVVIGFGAWWTYFDFAGHRPPRTGATAGLQWMLSNLPLTAAVAAMGAAMVSLVDHAHDSRAPAGAGWVLCAGVAVVLCATMLVSASLQARDSDRDLYKPLAPICLGVAIACIALGTIRPPPLAFGLILVVLVSIPWLFAVWHRVADAADSPSD